MNSPTLPKQPDLFGKATAVTLNLELKGPIPSFKNNKMLIVRDPSGRPLPRPLLITKPEFQEAMERMVSSIVSQLQCAFRLTGEPISAGSLIRSWIASCVPADDCWEKIPEIVIRGELCQPGQEGATITIERL